MPLQVPAAAVLPLVPGSAPLRPLLFVLSVLSAAHKTCVLLLLFVLLLLLRQTFPAGAWLRRLLAAGAWLLLLLHPFSAGAWLRRLLAAGAWLLLLLLPFFLELDCVVCLLLDLGCCCCCSCCCFCFCCVLLFLFASLALVSPPPVARNILRSNDKSYIDEITSNGSGLKGSMWRACRR